jgi:hypothetical protein
MKLFSKTALVNIILLTITPHLILSQTTEISIDELSSSVDVHDELSTSVDVHDEQKNDKSATKYREAGIGVGFGVVFNNYTNTNVSMGVGNSFRLIFDESKNTSFFTYNEQNAFSINFESTTTTGSETIQGIGVETGSDDYAFTLMVGSSKTYVATPSGSSSITGINDVGIIGDIGAIWKFDGEKRLNVSAGINYRGHPLFNPIKFTRSDNSTDQLTNLNSMIFQINMSYKF